VRTIQTHLCIFRTLSEVPTSRLALPWCIGENQQECAWRAVTQVKHVSTHFSRVWISQRCYSLLHPIVLDAALVEILTTCSKLEWLINHGERTLWTETRYSNLLMSYKKSQVVYQPKGVVSAIISWNYRRHPPPSSNHCYSFAQCLVTHHRHNICWKCNCAQVFQTHCLVDQLVHGRYT